MSNSLYMAYLYDIEHFISEKHIFTLRNYVIQIVEQDILHTVPTLHVFFSMQRFLFS